MRMWGRCPHTLWIPLSKPFLPVIWLYQIAKRNDV